MKINHLEELFNTLHRHSIDPNDVCIVGSAVMAALGLRENNDIDIIISTSHRKKLSDKKKCFNLSENIECVGVNWLYNLDEKTTDEDIIYKNENHFLKNGLKYCNIRLLLKRKKLAGRPKDKRDIELINDKGKNR